MSTDLTTTTDAPAASTTVADMFPVAADTQREFATQSSTTARALAAVDPASPDFQTAVDEIRSIGRDEVSSSSKALDELLGRRVIPESGNTPAIDVATAQLDDLRDAVVDLDPSGAPKTFRGKLSRAVSKMPGGQKFRKMVAGYESAGAQIKHIAEALKSSRETLTKDADLAHVEMQRLWGDLEVLGAHDAKFRALRGAVEGQIAVIRESGNERGADALESQALVAIGQRQQDVATHAAVVMNAYMTLKVLTDTGKKLSDSVYYAENTSLTALRLVSASDVVAGAQGAVADQVDAVRDMTGKLLVDSSHRLAAQTKRVNEQSHKTAVAVDSLKEAFRVTYGAIEDATKSGIEANKKIQAQLDDLNTGLAEYRDKGFAGTGRKSVTA